MPEVGEGVCCKIIFLCVVETVRLPKINSCLCIIFVLVI